MWDLHSLILCTRINHSFSFNCCLCLHSLNDACSKNLFIFWNEKCAPTVVLWLLFIIRQYSNQALTQHKGTPTRTHTRADGARVCVVCLLSVNICRIMCGLPWRHAAPQQSPDVETLSDTFKWREDRTRREEGVKEWSECERAGKKHVGSRKRTKVSAN